MVGSPWNDETQARHLAILTGVSRLTDDSEVDACATTLVNADTSSVAQALREQIGGAEVMPFVCAQAAEHADGAALQQPPAAACVTGERLGRGARVSDDAIAELAARDPCAAFDLFERQAGQTASAFLREWHYDYEEMLASTTAIHARVQYSLLPLGPVHCVTAATAHFIETLNGQPAMDVLLRDTGELMARNPMHFLDFVYAATLAEDGSDEHMTVRDLVGRIDCKGMVALDQAVSPGSKLIFCKVDARESHNNIIAGLSDLESQLDGRRPRAGVYYSARDCIGVRSVADELGLIHSTLGDFPMAGLFANGGFAGRGVTGDAAHLTVFACPPSSEGQQAYDLCQRV